jgi:type IV pilus assembly protein PilF
MKAMGIRFGLVLLFALSMAGCKTTITGSQGELRTSSDMTDAQTRASIRLQLAAGYYQQKQMSVALDEIKKALLIDPNNLDAYIIRAVIYMEMDEMRLAEENFKRALAIAPDNPDLANNYGWYLCLNGQEEKSIAYFEAAVNNRSYQSPPKALNNAGLCSLKMKNNQGAEAYFNRAFRYDPASPETNTNMAKLHYARADYEKAHFYISRVSNAKEMTADMLWTAIKIARKRNDRSAEAVQVANLRRLYPGSPEFSAYQRGAFNE